MRRLSTRASRRTSALALAGCALAAVIAAGCAGGQVTAARPTVLNVGERDFDISAPRSVRAGDVVLRVHNRGPDDHELIVVRSDHALPLRRDDLTVNEEALQHVEAGALEPGEPGSVRELHLHLAPGRYVLLCNMAGHYLGGMHTVLVVH